jgi:hypothetical protein
MFPGLIDRDCAGDSRYTYDDLGRGKRADADSDFSPSYRDSADCEYAPGPGNGREANALKETIEIAKTRGDFNRRPGTDGASGCAAQGSR